MKKPAGVGHPPSLAIVTHEPMNFWNSLYVSGFATKKKTRVVYAAYFAFKAKFIEYTGFAGASDGISSWQIDSI
jgi:hypothetical protein